MHIERTKFFSQGDTINDPSYPTTIKPPSTQESTTIEKIQHLVRTTVDDDRAVLLRNGSLRVTEGLNLTDNVQTIGHLAEDDVLAVQPAGLHSGNEELGAVSTRKVQVLVSLHSSLCRMRSSKVR